MPYIRRLPSGRWQATVRDPNGKRYTFTDPVKRAVRQWAARQEAQRARSEFRDPHLGDLKVGDWHARVSRSRGIEAVTKTKNASLWRTHCEPEWGPWPMTAVTRLEAQAWVDRLKSTRRARHQAKPVRPGEMYGLHGHRVDWLRVKIHVVDVMTRSGLRQWPKSKRSHRVVPVPAHILESMSPLLAGRLRDSLMFTAPHGGPVTDGHFRNRVWYPAVEAAGIRRFPPRIMRRTSASWLVQDGVPLYDVQALLGHEDYATTERYTHLAPGAHEKVIESWERRRTSDARRTARNEARPS